MNKATIRKKLIEAGIKNLEAFGYTGVTKENILTEHVLAQFFRKMLADDENHVNADVKLVCDELIAEIDKVKIAVKPKKKGVKS